MVHLFEAQTPTGLHNCKDINKTLIKNKPSTPLYSDEEGSQSLIAFTTWALVKLATTTVSHPDYLQMAWSGRHLH